MSNSSSPPPGAALPSITLVLGGARSGKSRHAEGLLAACPGPWLYVATAEIRDEEMRARVDAHRARRGESWITREVPLALADCLAESDRPALVDCLTLWLTNLMLAEQDIEAAAGALLAALDARPAPTVLVANEVGLGIVPDNALARRFRDEAGRLNQRLAAAADYVVFLAAGLPLVLKGEGRP